jgi:hypothetical protein
MSGYGVSGGDGSGGGDVMKQTGAEAGERETPDAEYPKHGE